MWSSAECKKLGKLIGLHKDKVYKWKWDVNANENKVDRGKHDEFGGYSKEYNCED